MKELINNIISLEGDMTKLKKKYPFLDFFYSAGGVKLIITNDVFKIVYDYSSREITRKVLL